MPHISFVMTKETIAKRKAILQHFIDQEAISEENSIFPDKEISASKAFRKLSRKKIIKCTDEGRYYVDKALMLALAQARKYYLRILIIIALLLVLALIQATLEK